MRILNFSVASVVGIICSIFCTFAIGNAAAFQATVQTSAMTGLPNSTPVIDSATTVDPASNLQTKNAQALPVGGTAATTKTNWQSLSTEQKTALAPLASEWDKMDAVRQKKWLGVANKYSNMKPEEQQRVQERVQAWGKMTPEQRMAVRENFANTTKKTAEQKSAQWQQYQQLSDEEKQKLANEAKVKKTITTIQPESKRITPPIAPLKKGPPPAASAASAAQASIK